MEYYDQHMHTNFSFDSKEKMENYLSLVGNRMVTTEHLEFNNPEEKNQDSVPDYDAYVKEINRLKEKSGKRIYRGVEIGYSAGQEDKIRDYLAKHEFDVKILSFHQNGDLDFMNDKVRHMDPIDVATQYYKMMWKGINAFHDADILAHFDYGIRKLNLTSGMFQTTAGVLLTNIFKIAIRHDMAFELNTKSMYKYHNIGLYDYAIEIYKQLGGKRFTIGSDAHDAKNVYSHYDEALEMLKAHDIHHINIYSNNAMTVMPIDDVDEGIRY
ncbi:histidinol-phosphatase HisJ family protein [Pediococcus argentinicus]|uniref:Histidinol-phosphatase n=1 Tax=Pediococcus argentinicus TaxID=480391 RepID=A0A0R2NNS3_9LACO|nr:histidinol-phosphatase HisJ family protein [Pediococcus argentinicus]KRO26080.1 hypothetical protein IV88_GL000995 [Pediococcus argentinicus]NKZ21741.1 histidinol-phosphatase HisJ family protein [Pediococcus argentinicus]GEP18905.1 histidinol-phosphatase [Pediococcus argentinicus]